jgi:hypothetical protein
MAFAIITGLHYFRKFCLLLSKSIQLFHDILYEPYNHGSIKVLLCCWLQVVDQFQQATKSTLRVAQFSMCSCCPYSSSP